jgi:hypothetical protein
MLTLLSNGSSERTSRLVVVGGSKDQHRFLLIEPAWGMVMDPGSLLLVVAGGSSSGVPCASSLFGTVTSRNDDIGGTTSFVLPALPLPDIIAVVVAGLLVVVVVVVVVVVCRRCCCRWCSLLLYQQQLVL